MATLASADLEHDRHQHPLTGLTPTWLVSALHTSDAPLPLVDLPQVRWDAVSAHNLRSAYLACKYLMPLMTGGGAVVLLASVYAGWDVRAEAAAQAPAMPGCWRWRAHWRWAAGQRGCASTRSATAWWRGPSRSRATSGSGRRRAASAGAL